LALPLADIAAPAGAAVAANEAVIPRPAEVVRAHGAFQLGPRTDLRVAAGDAGARAAARYFAGLLARCGGPELAIQTGGATAGAVSFARVRGLGAQAYRLEVTPQQIRVQASTSAGLFYGAVTLWQLLPPGRGQGAIGAQTIRDQPAYAWRGLMLDSARHFQPPAFIKTMIDWMAWHKLNVLQWHLTDDQGWRLEIPRYPRLTAIGAWRTPAAIPGVRKSSPAQRYGGFYSDREVRDIVAFAARRHVRIVPEIDMPGHARAAIAAYPWLGAAGAAGLTVSSAWGVHRRLFNLEPATFRFLENVLDEVMALFPSRFVHIGGDEVVADEWNASPAVRARARAFGIRDAGGLQAYFTQRIGAYLAAHGRRMIGWDEVLQPGLPKGAVVMSWHGASGAHAAAVAGYDTILAASPTLYFDNRQSTLPSEPPGRLQVVSLQDVYRFDLRDPSLDHAERRHVLGLQGNIWTEHINSPQRIEWMALPRAAAVAERGWTPRPRRGWRNFLERLVPMFARYRAMGLRVADSAFAIAAHTAGGAAGVSLSLSKQADIGRIRYTLDGSEPRAESPVYAAPLLVPVGATVRAASFVGAVRVSRIWSERLDAHTLERKDSHALQLCTDGIGLLLEPAAGGAGSGTPIAIDIMNPCWIDRGVDLSTGPRLTAAVAPLAFNYAVGADVGKIRVGDAQTADGELEVRIDGCDRPPALRLALAPAARQAAVTELPPRRLPRIAGRHDLCLRFARPRLDPQWGLDWIRIGE